MTRLGLLFHLPVRQTETEVLGRPHLRLLGGTLANPTLGRLKQGHWCESEASPVYKVKHCLKDQSRTQQGPCLGTSKVWPHAVPLKISG